MGTGRCTHTHTHTHTHVHTHTHTHVHTCTHICSSGFLHSVSLLEPHSIQRKPICRIIYWTSGEDEMGDMGKVKTGEIREG